MKKNKISELKLKLYDIAKAEQERRFHSLYDKIQRMDVLKEAWEFVRKNAGSPGVDGISINKLKSEGIVPLLTERQTELKAQIYMPSALKRVYIPKANGKNRPLSIPKIKDRITQTAIKIIIEPIFESPFEPNSLGFRPDKSAHDAVDEIVKYLNYGCENVIDTDISQCFDNIDKHKLMEQVAKRISDGGMLHLIDYSLMQASWKITRYTHRIKEHLRVHRYHHYWQTYTLTSWTNNGKHQDYITDSDKMPI